ncbi:hypothetical protein CONLIGDRAFT_670574 [Coniochaeta ligniaria NRRL 30616]|uniref:Uncharacterized protein n=1 Tax=Coniochaeta ligniaria NRRL 30616 TaxID=1408157 RepID=A0A1J7IML5_9PEZI|nr:hypothetical protein CONLIGDRAFT_670574 [Coniochaeta ligniaria NRRL 30616]
MPERCKRECNVKRQNPHLLPNVIFASQDKEKQQGGVSQDAQFLRAGWQRRISAFCMHQRVQLQRIGHHSADRDWQERRRCRSPCSKWVDLWLKEMLRGPCHSWREGACPLTVRELVDAMTAKSGIERARYGGYLQIPEPVNKVLASSPAEQLAALQPAQLGVFASSLWASSAVRAARAIIVSAEINRLAAKRAAVVDKGLVFLDGHLDEFGEVTWNLVVSGPGAGRGEEVMFVLCKEIRDEEMMYDEMKRNACGMVESLSTWDLMLWKDLQNFPSLRGGGAGEVHDMRDEHPSYGPRVLSRGVDLSRQT